MPPENTSCSAPSMTSRRAFLGMKPSAPRSSALMTLARSLSADRTTTEIAG